MKIGNTEKGYVIIGNDGYSTSETAFNTEAEAQAIIDEIEGYIASGMNEYEASAEANHNWIY